MWPVHILGGIRSTCYIYLWVLLWCLQDSTDRYTSHVCILHKCLTEMHLIQLKHQSVYCFTLINIIHLWFRWRHTISIWITLPKCLNQFRINKPDTIHLVAQCYPKQKNKHYSSTTESHSAFIHSLQHVTKLSSGKVFYLYPWTPSLSILLPSVPPGKPIKAMTTSVHIRSSTLSTRHTIRHCMFSAPENIVK